MCFLKDIRFDLEGSTFIHIGTELECPLTGIYGFKIRLLGIFFEEVHSSLKIKKIVLEHKYFFEIFADWYTPK